jgi:hypothetical protein
MFEELMSRIEKIEKTLSLLLDLHMQQSNSLTTYKDVAKLFGVTPRTVNNYIRESKLVKDKHYYIDHKGKTVFIPHAVMEFKKNVSEAVGAEPNGMKSMRVVMHPIASRVLKGVA